MDSIDDARDARATRLRDAQHSVQLLLDFVGKHAEAVDGLDREQLSEIRESLRTWDSWLAGVAADGAASVSVPRLTDALVAVAEAGYQSLQILGGRLARNEPWGGPFDDDASIDGGDT
jgi:hypothetical protein